MNLIFLGTSAGAPTRSRNVTALALQWMHTGKIWLFDCGEGTQHRFHKAPISISRIDRIFISHLHGDHVFGLPGLMASLSAAQNSEDELAVHGPEPLFDYLQQSLTLTHTRIKYVWTFYAIAEGCIHEDDRCTVECRLLNHGIPSYGYAVVEKPHVGQFLPEKARELGVEPGPAYGELKAGGEIVNADGTVVRSVDVVGPSRPSRKVVICGDTGLSDATVQLASGADVLVHEATLMKDQTERAIAIGHSTAAQAAETALKAGVKQLILTHFSPRYDQDDGNLMTALLAEARDIFPNTLLAEDYLTYNVALGA